MSQERLALEDDETSVAAMSDPVQEFLKKSHELVQAVDRDRPIEIRKHRAPRAFAEEEEPAKPKRSPKLKPSPQSPVRLTPVFRRTIARQNSPEKMRFGRDLDATLGSDDEAESAGYAAMLKRKRPKEGEMRISELGSRRRLSADDSGNDAEVELVQSPGKERRPHPMQLLTQRRVLPQPRVKLEIQFVQGLEFGVPCRKNQKKVQIVEEEEDEGDGEVGVPYFMVSPLAKSEDKGSRAVTPGKRKVQAQEEEEEDEEEDDDDMTIGRFFNGRSIPFMNVSDDDHVAIQFKKKVDMSDITFNLTALCEDTEEDCSDSG